MHRTLTALLVVLGLGTTLGTACHSIPPPRLPALRSTRLCLQDREFIVPDRVLNCTWDFYHRATDRYEEHEWIHHRVVYVTDDGIGKKSGLTYFRGGMYSYRFTSDETEGWRVVLATPGHIIIREAAIGDPLTLVALQHERAHRAVDRLVEDEADAVSVAYETLENTGVSYAEEEFVPFWCTGTIPQPDVRRVRTEHLRAFRILERLRCETAAR